jgi:hypothetical protein
MRGYCEGTPRRAIPLADARGKPRVAIANSNLAVGGGRKAHEGSCCWPSQLPRRLSSHLQLRAGPRIMSGRTRPAPHLRTPRPRAQCHLLIDFDGTVAPDDPTDRLLERFAHPAWLDIERPGKPEEFPHVNAWRDTPSCCG